MNTELGASEASLLGPITGPKPPIQVKDYQIHLPPLGEGSFGTVYRATYRGISERALKIFKPDHLDISATSRELEKLSSVAEHPGIVTLHDFDLVSNTPYYAMSLHADRDRDGNWSARSLEKFCGKLDAKENARLIDEITSALAYLHRHQVLHCDIKPSNVLLTDDRPYPGIKICDFGQSRASNLRSSDVVGTPLYSSPEQLLHPDQSSGGRGFKWDVYSFGVLAYKLITGKLPRLQNVIDGGTFDAFERSIDEIAETDGTATDTHHHDDRAHIAKMLFDEEVIEWPPDAKIDFRRKAIITRCLSLNRAERPADMREVRNEILRSQQERVAVRNRNFTLSLAGIAALALMATGWALVEAQRAQQAIQSEQKARRDAEELVNFMVVDMREKLEPLGKMELLEHIAYNADSYFSSLSKDMQTVETLELIVQARHTNGDTSLMRQQYDEAIESYQKVFNICNQLEANGKGSPDLRFRATQALAGLGKAYYGKGDIPMALDYFGQARALMDVENPRGTTPEDYLRSTAHIHLNMAEIYRTQDKAKSALEQYESALAISAKVLPLPDQRMPQLNLLSHLRISNQIGAVALSVGDSRKARTHYEEAIRYGQDNLRGSLTGTGSGIQMEVATAYHGLGTLALAEGAAEEALTHLRQELRLREAIQQQNRTDAEATIALAECHAALAQCYDLTDRANRNLALANFNRAVRMLEQMRRSTSWDERRESLIDSYNLGISSILEMEE